ncbi:P-loop containing nucleoside triphosphate hydrolase protein [Crucibulum laeve]|uniref:P-loop containing nucleoside triphosphate hydrolase protein n=1 Tax=Crucibulum laeve TaxID=68775 RepID=A0A5C3LJ50_9AGAR|nr:P-loop containing nucleoside triphosphate hydrolase protein [Crucibulum laeve]
MHRRISTLVKASSSRAAVYDDGDTESKVETITARDEPLPIPSLKVKRVDNYYSRWTKGWKYRNSNAKIAVESLPVLQGGTNEQWKDYSFVIVRTIPRQENMEPTFKVVIKSEYILKACKDVIQSWPGISWNSDPLEMDPEIFITFFQEFIAYQENLASKKHMTPEEKYLHSSVALLTNTLASDYRTTLNTVHRLTTHGEITFELLYTILVPRTIFVATCAITGLPRLFRLESWMRKLGDYALFLESVDIVDKPNTQTVGVGKVQTMVYIKMFKGTIKILDLNAYPIKYHPDENGLKQSVMSRGKKWASLNGVHHMQYEGVAALKLGDKLLKHNVRSRIMIDRTSFKRQNPNYVFPLPVPPKAKTTDPRSPWGSSIDEYGHPLPPMPPMPMTPPMPTHPMPYTNDELVSNTRGEDPVDVELTDDELLLTPSIVYGFSLGDKVWLEFNVEKISDVEWNNDAFSNLVLPTGRKDLLQSLVESHHRGIGFDDFIKGKGHGLVVNLFGPPGVGKTFSAEATSEHVRRPLYVIGGGDLGTKAADLDLALERVFDVATAWKAIVLIDEADVFLEQRSLHDLERNAMVAVFLRHVEYYRGILFLTTNRVKAFDEAFLSRIHVALHFRELSHSSKEQVWAAFIAKIGASANVTPEEISLLAEKQVNGRQIKNAARTAHSLAVGRGEELRFEHLMQTLDAMEEFTKEFEKRDEA